jgi:hypothetical protein
MHRMPWSSRLAGLGLVALSLAAFTPKARALTVSVSPADTTAICGDTLMVRVMVDGFSDLEAYQLIFSFNPAILQYVGAEVGPLGDFLESLPDVTPPVDSVWVDCAKLAGNSNGPGMLAGFRFVADDKGVSPITCLRVDLRDSENVSYTPACVGGIVRTPYCPTPTLARTWGRIKTIYR